MVDVDVVEGGLSTRAAACMHRGIERERIIIEHKKFTRWKAGEP